MENYNQLTPAETERLAILSEEMAEAIQIIGKIIRHGYENYNPDAQHLGTNREMLEKELGHIRSSMLMLCNNKDVSKAQIHWWADKKSEDIKKWLHHQP